MKLENYVAKSAKKMFQVNKLNESTIGLFKDLQKGHTFFCVAWIKKGDKEPKFKFYTQLNEAITCFNNIEEVI